MVMTPLISIGGAMVGGLWVPSAMLPKIVQTIGHFTPQYWAQQSLLNIFAHGSHIGGVIGSTAVLLLFGLVGLAVALLRLPGFMRSSTN
jgi:ABC-2 type transport system permease protein